MSTTMLMIMLPIEIALVAFSAFNLRASIRLCAKANDLRRSSSNARSSALRSSSHSRPSASK